MRARLADARFFWEEDQKAALEARLDKLGGIVFHNRLGTVREKVERVERLAGVDRRRRSGSTPASAAPSSARRASASATS